MAKIKSYTPLLVIIALWQKGVSPYIGHHCRFEPSCSEYGRQALIRHGLLKGLWLLVKRILRCQPLNPGGFDPVPEIATDRWKTTHKKQ